MSVGFAAVLAARRRIAGHVLRTGMRESAGLSRRLGVPVHLKLEHQQTTGSFKLRGATNALMCLPPEARARGVATASTGNHGRALAHAAAALGVRATICMSALVPGNKREAVAATGAEVRIVGRSQDDAQEEVDRMVAQDGVAAIPPFDHADVIAGQGTLGVEILEDVPEAGTIVVPLSGGGLIAGIALAAKAARPGVRVVGVSLERGPAMIASLKAGRPVAVEEQESLADSLGGGIGLENRYTFAMVRDLVDATLTVSEAAIAEGMRWAYAQEGEVLEGGAAVGITAVLAGRIAAAGPVVLVLSGRNVDTGVHRRIICGEGGDA